MQSIKPLCILLLAISPVLVLANGKLECEELPVDLCAFAVSSLGARCVLENSVLEGQPVSVANEIRYECQTSGVMAPAEFAGLVETDDCVRKCGLERMSVGISSDALTDVNPNAQLCSTPCQSSCANLLDLYTKLAAEEGTTLAQLCQRRRELFSAASLASLSSNGIDAWEFEHHRHHRRHRHHEAQAPDNSYTWEDPYWIYGAEPPELPWWEDPPYWPYGAQPPEPPLWWADMDAGSPSEQPWA